MEYMPYPIWKCLTYGAVQSLYKEGFHVMSYQANFANHPTRDRHVGFLLHGRV